MELPKQTLLAPYVNCYFTLLLLVRVNKSQKRRIKVVQLYVEQNVSSVSVISCIGRLRSLQRFHVLVTAVLNARSKGENQVAAHVTQANYTRRFHALKPRSE